MPEISRFLGIVVYLLYDDHRPPHFHARYSELQEWHAQHKDELRCDWELAGRHCPLSKIPPLE